MIRVLIADDQALLRASFRLLLESAPDMDVVGEAGDGRTALAECRRLTPDVVLMDLQMPGVDGVEATRRIGLDPELANLRVLVLTMFDLDEYVYPALRAGASGFLLKDTSPQELIAAIRTVFAGESILAPAVTRRVLTRLRDAAAPREPPADLTRLTDRQRQVLELIANGLSNAEIAAELRLSMPTVKTHVSHLLAALNARDRVHLVISAYLGGLVGVR